MVGSAIVETIERNPGREAVAVADICEESFLRQVVNRRLDRLMSELRTELDFGEMRTCSMDIEDWRNKIDELDRQAWWSC